MKVKLIAVLVVLALVMTSGISLAQRGRGGPGLGMGRGMQGSCGLGLGLGLGPTAMSDLNLSQDQTTRLQKITDQFLAETQSQRTQLQSRLVEVASLMTAETPNEAAIRAKVAEADTIRTKIRNAMMDRTFSVMSVLTVEQKAKLRASVKNQQGSAVNLGYGLCFGCSMNGAGCYFMGGTGAGGYGPGRGMRQTPAN